MYQRYRMFCDLPRLLMTVFLSTFFSKLFYSVCSHLYLFYWMLLECQGVHECLAYLGIRRWKGPVYCISHDSLV